jgi:Uma2 family endonuclease
MAIKALITPQQYLATQFEREPELVHGELVERPLPNLIHGRTQQRLAVHLDGVGYCCTEVRMRLAEDLYRIPDVAVFEGTGPTEAVPTAPPRLVVELSSPEDRLDAMLQKLDEYRTWGVRHIWLIEPERQRIHVYDRGSLTAVSRLELAEFGFTVTAQELFA